MKIHISLEKDYVTLRARAEGEDVVGDYQENVYPGQSAMGYSYDELRGLGNGAFDLTPKEPAK